MFGDRSKDINEEKMQNDVILRLHEYFSMSYF